MEEQAAAEVVQESAPEDVVIDTEYGTIEVSAEVAAEMEASAASDNAAEVVDPAPTEEVADGEESTPSEEAEEGVEAAATEEEEKPSDKAQARFDKLTREKYEEKRRADALETRLLALEEAKAAKPATEPTLEDYDFDEGKYLEAKAEYIAQGKVAQYQAEAKQRTALDTEAKRVAKYTAAADEFKVGKDDYQPTIDGLQGILTSATVASALVTMAAPEVTYHLGKHIGLVDELNQMTPVDALVKLGEIRAELRVPPKPKPLSKAPAPVTTVGGGGTTKDPMTRYEVKGATFE